MDFEEIRKMIIVSLFADDDLYERFVLKGGNALLAHGVNKRASMDIDVSINGSFSDDEIDNIKDILEKNLDETFRRKDHTVIDVKLEKHPFKLPPDKQKFWGGCQLEFKIVSLENKKKFDNGEIGKQQLRQSASVIGEKQLKTFKVDISHFEYCEKKEEKEIDGFPIYIYTPIIIIYEKLRAICQQQEEYKKLVGVKVTPRARDFFDIYSILEHHKDCDNIKENILKEENLKDLKEIFSLKKVPLDLLDNIENYRSFHEEDFVSVEPNVKNIKLESYDFYFDYTLSLAKKILKELANLGILDNTTSTS
jgi:hypothetical protein